MVRGKRLAKTFDTKSEADAWRIEVSDNALQEGRLHADAFGAVLQHWLAHIQATKDQNTFSAYDYAVQPFTKLGNVQAFSLRTINLQSVLDGLSGRTAQMAHDKIRQCVRWAIKMGMMASDPTEHLERPKHERESIEVFTLAEIPRILEEAEHLKFHGAILLALSCGLRGGEIWGLQWSDWKGNELSINRQSAERSGIVQVKPPKRNSSRTIALPDSVVAAFEARNSARVREGLAGCEWIFPDSRGNVTRRTNFAARTWKPLLKRAGVAARGFHHCRHTAASVLLNSGVPITVVARILGHKDAATTLAIYAHLMTSELGVHRNVFDRVFGVA